MNSWLKIAALGTAAAAVIGVAAYFGVPVLRQIIGETPPSSSADFSKSAYDQNGNPITGPVSAGQVIQYVLRYKPPASTTSAPATIDDTLSANQSYVPGSVSAPGWTLSTPVYGANHETYTNPNFGPAAFIMTVPAISGSAGLAGAGGDGYQPIPVVTSTGVKVFGTFHHQPWSGFLPRIMCWYGANLTKCNPAYPQYTSTPPDRRATPDFPHAAVYNKKIYFPTGRYDESTLTTAPTVLEFGISCWDAEADAECPFIHLPGNPSLTMAPNTSSSYLGTNLDGYVAGVRADPQNPSRLYMYAAGNIYCVDVALPGAPACTGWSVPSPIAPISITGRSSDMYVDEGGTHLYFSNTTPAVHCVKLSDGSLCPGWPAAGVNGGAIGATHLGPGIDNTGTMTAICLSQAFLGASNFRCFDLATGANATSWPASLLTASIFAAYHIPGTTRVLYPPYLNSSAPQCYDFSGSGAYCTPFTPYWNSQSSWVDGSGTTQSAVADYGYAADPTTPQSCIYGLGDGGVLVRFGLDGKEATGACAPKTYHATFNLFDQFCFHKPGQATWTNIVIDHRPTTLTGGTLTLKDSSGTVIQTITVGSANSYPLNISALGANSTVTIDFTPTYSGNALPTTDYQIELDYTADEDSQICYQTTVTACGAVSNAATLKDDLATLQANVNLGTVVGGTCGPAPNPDCLMVTPSILASPSGTGALTLTLGGPSGFTPKLVTVTSLTPGVTVAPPSRTFAIGQTQGTWSLSGLTPGMTVKFKVDAVDVGGGSKPGTDKCCSSTITVTVPAQREPPQPGSGKVDLAIKKTGVASTEGRGGPIGTQYTTGYTFTLSATNVGDPINGHNAVVVSDTVPPGLTFTNAAGTDWNCGPVSQFPIAAGGVLTCTYVGTVTLASGAPLPPIMVNATLSGSAMRGGFLNCATVGVSAGSGYTDSNGANDKSCYSGRTPGVTPPVPPRPVCDKSSTRADNDGDCACRYPGMVQNSATQCTCARGQPLVPGVGCVKKQPPDCDPRSTILHGEVCRCLDTAMHRLSETQCGCPRGGTLVKGVGCVAPHTQTPPVEPRTACAAGTNMDVGGQCVPVCTAPMTLNDARDACECPKGTKLSDGACVKKSSFFDKVLGNVHIGVGVGGGSGGRGDVAPKAGPVQGGP